MSQEMRDALDESQRAFHRLLADFGSATAAEAQNVAHPLTASEAAARVLAFVNTALDNIERLRANLAAVAEARAEERDRAHSECIGALCMECGRYNLVPVRNLMGGWIHENVGYCPAEAIHELRHKARHPGAAEGTG